MILSLFHSLQQNVWTMLLTLVFFGACIFVHELGHFLAARWRGLHVERFSIGFGSPIVSWRDRAGVEWRIAWFPFGGYVLLPQIADLGALEGKVSADVSKLPPVSYGSKLIVFVAGAAFNVLFAFVIACVLWRVGVPEPSNAATTTIGSVSRTLEMPDGTTVPSPAFQAGIKPGDRVIAVDGESIRDWADLSAHIVLGSGRTATGQPEVTLQIDRNGQPLTLHLHPVLAGEDGTRQIGILAERRLIVSGVTAGSPAAQAGLEKGDLLTSIDGSPSPVALDPFDYIENHPGRPLSLGILRDGRPLTLTIPPLSAAKAKDIGITDFEVDIQNTHPSPFSQIWEQFTMTLRTLGSLLNPNSNVGLSKMAGPIGIVHIFNDAASVGLRAVFLFSILINVNLAVLNLLPIPVFDGGHILFATIAWIRGRSLPVSFIIYAQSVFFVLIVIMFSYVSVFDVSRWFRDARADRPPPAAAPAPTPAPAGH